MRHRAPRRGPFCRLWGRNGMFREDFLKLIQVSQTIHKFALCPFTFTKDLHYCLFCSPTEFSPFGDGNCFFTLPPFQLTKRFHGNTPLLDCSGGGKPVLCNCCISRPLLSLPTKHQTFLFPQGIVNNGEERVFCKTI